MSGFEGEFSKGSFGDFARNMPQMPAVVPNVDDELEEAVEHPKAPAPAAPVADSFDDEEFVLAFKKDAVEPPVFECGHLPVQEAAWITILLHDEQDQPVADEPYRVTLADGSLREGKTDTDGRADIEDAEAGVCSVVWPGIDGRDFGVTRWDEEQGDDAEAVADGAADDEAQAETDFITVQLLDEDGQPVAGEAWRIECPDGTIHEGQTDAEGQATIPEMPAGTCRVTWPDIDASEVSEA